MPNKNYQKGKRFEQELVRQARAKGCISFRSAASKSPIDVCIIDTENKKITFIQAKTGKASVTQKYKKEFEDLSDEYVVEFKIKNRYDKRLKKNK